MNARRLQVPGQLAGPTGARAPLGRRHQRGISLFVIIIIVLLSMLLALWASRTSLFNEMVVGNDADYQRTFEAAQAMIQDAELDIRRERADGTVCTNPLGTGDVCRLTTGVRFPAEDAETFALVDYLVTKPTRCASGICQKRTGAQDFWADPTTLSAMIAPGVGARYGQFTGAPVGATGDNKSNPILKKTAAGEGAWYWVEVMPYSSAASMNPLIVGSADKMLPLNVKPSVAYRITAIARGQKSGTQVVLQQTYVRQKLKN